MFLVQVQQSRLDTERLSEELESQRKDLRAWEERLKGRKAELEREKAAVEGETTSCILLESSRVAITHTYADEVA